MIIVPALNEAEVIGDVVKSVRSVLPDVPVFVIDDYSEDATAAVAEAAGARVIRLPVHLGVGGCVQTGYKLAFELGFDYVIRVDGDGQHEARDIPKIRQTLIETGAEVVIGSRFIERGRRTHVVFQIYGNRLLSDSVAGHIGQTYPRSHVRLRRRKPNGVAGLLADLSPCLSGN